MNKTPVIAVLLAPAALGRCATNPGPQGINETGRLKSLKIGHTTGRSFRASTNPMRW